MARRMSAFGGVAERREPAPGSERSFAAVFAAVLIAVGLFPVIDGGAVRLWALAAAGIIAAAGMLAPRVLRPANHAWFRFGLLLHGVMSPLVLGLLYGVVVTPVGLLMRLARKDPLRLRRDAAAASYWTLRTPPGPAADSFKNQF